MKLLWIGRRGEQDSSGAAIYDRMTVEALGRAGHDVEVLAPERLMTAREILQMLVFVPFERARYFCLRNLRAARRRSSNADFVVLSHECFDFLATVINKRRVLILHNLSSCVLRNAFGNSFWTLPLWLCVVVWERWLYRSKKVDAIVVLSRRDMASVLALRPKAKVLWLPPGCPKLAPLSKGALISPKLVLSGSYDWFPKRRDLRRFLVEHATATHRLPIVTDDRMPDGVATYAQIGRAHFDDVALTSNHIRFGVIPDRFDAGHKLKTLFFIANNCFVLSFAEIRTDFSHLPDHEFFIRQVSSVDDISAIVAGIESADAIDVCDRLRAFKARCAQEFSWERNASELISLASLR